MVINHVIKILLIALLSSCILKCVAAEKMEENCNILFFENYINNDVVIKLDNILNSKNILYTDSILVKEDMMLNPNNNLIIGELFDILCRIDIINQWNINKYIDINPYSFNHEEYIIKRKRELEITFLGNLKLSKNFKSYIIVVSIGNSNYYNIVREAFLINIADEKTSSITRISSYTCFDGECNYIYTKMSRNGVFIQTDKKDNRGEDIRGIEFVFDKKGHLIRK